jgi:uncharacterized membrane protein HdeD (DUF308 family)
MFEQDHRMGPDTGLFLSINNNFMKMFTASRLLIAAAAAWLLTGTLALTSYHNDYLPAVQFAGIALLLDGLLLVAVCYNCGATRKEKKWIIAEAAVDGIFSIPLLLDPVFTFFVFPFVVTPWIVTKGLVTMIAALSLKKDIHGWSGDLTGGFLLICCGLLISHNPMDNPYGVNVLIGGISWTIGLLYLYDAYRFRKTSPTFHESALGKTTA